MKLTHEQEKVIDYVKNISSPENVALIALAGAGKTSTLKAIAETLKDKKILYLVFSKDMKKEAEKKFPQNTEVFTINSLAYNCMELKYEPLSKYDIHIVMDNVFCSELEAKSVIKEIEEFCLSDEKEMNRYEYSDYARKFWDKISNGEIYHTHASYMKYFVTNFDKFIQKLDYDLLLVDESQDLNPIALTLTQKLAMPRIFVGDPNQNIFGFNNSVNVFEILNFNKVLHLTQSFRCSKQIADIANAILAFKGENLQMQSSIEHKKPTNQAFITRTNSKIVDILYKYLENYDLNNLDNVRIPTLKKSIKEIFDAPITIRNLIKFAENGDEPYIRDKNLFWLKRAIIDKQMDKKEFQSFCLSCGDSEVRQAYLLLVSTYKKSMSLSQLELALKKLQQKHANMPNTFLLTAHSSKGLEFDKVIICDDFPDLKELRSDYNKTFADSQFGRNLDVKEKAMSKLDDSQESYVSESNLYYVAVTRAKDELVDKSKNEEIFFSQTQEYKIAQEETNAPKL